MNFGDADTAWAQELLGPHDPVIGREADLAGDAAIVRTAVAARIEQPHVGGRTWGPRLGYAAAALFLAVGSLLGVGLRADPAWAVSTTPDGLIKVEFATILGRGPEPQPLVEALERAGVQADTEPKTRLWPPAHGRVVGSFSTWKPDPEDLEAGMPDDIAVRAGLQELPGNGGYLIDAEKFAAAGGHITFYVGQRP